MGSLEATDPPQLMWRGNITDWHKVDELVMELEMTDISVRLDRYVGTKLDSTAYPRAALEDIGKVMPIVYGANNMVVGLRAAWGVRTTLAATITPTSTSLKLSLTLAEYQAMGASGSLWVDDERIAYGSITVTTDSIGQAVYTLNGVTRGYGLNNCS